MSEAEYMEWKNKQEKQIKTVTLKVYINEKPEKKKRSIDRLFPR